MLNKHFINNMIIDKRYTVAPIIDNTFKGDDEELLINMVAEVNVVKQLLPTLKPQNIDISYMVGEKQYQMSVKGSLFFANYAQELKSGYHIMRIGLRVSQKDILSGDLILQ